MRALLGAHAAAGGGGGIEPDEVANLWAWWDFSDASTLYTDTGRTTLVGADGDVIQGVTDKSGNGVHLASSTGPTYKTNVQNGLSVARFNGTTQFLGRAAGSSGFAQPATLFHVYDRGRPSEAAGDPRVVVLDGALFAGSSIGGITTTSGVFFLQTSVANGASSSVRIDGAALAAGNAGTNGSNNPRIMRYGASSYFAGDVGEIFIYTAVVGTTDRDGLETSRLSKWGL